MANSVIDNLGRAWIPEEMLRALGIDGAAEMQVEVDVSTGTLVLRAVGAIPDEDYSHYTPQAHEARARDLAIGRSYRVGRAELERLAADPGFIDEIRTNPAFRDTEPVRVRA